MAFLMRVAAIFIVTTLTVTCDAPPLTSSDEAPARVSLALEAQEQLTEAKTSQEMRIGFVVPGEVTPSILERVSIEVVALQNDDVVESFDVVPTPSPEGGKLWLTLPRSFDALDARVSVRLHLADGSVRTIERIVPRSLADSLPARELRAPEVRRSRPSDPAMTKESRVQEEER